MRTIKTCVINNLNMMLLVLDVSDTFSQLQLCTKMNTFENICF